MANSFFSPKTWVDRISEYPTRRKLTATNGTVSTVTVERSEGTVSQAGDAFSATNMNALEQRINSAFDSVNSDLGNKQNKTWTKFNASSPVNLTTYSEIMVVLGTSSGGVIAQAIPTCVLTSSYTLFQLGAGSATNGVTYGANIKNNSWASATPYINGSATTYNITELYYR